MVTELVLLAPGGREPATLTVDQIAVYGVLGHAAAPAADDESVAPAAYLQTADLPAQAATAAATGPALTPVRPAVQRVVQWQGEPLAELARLGFTGVLVEGTPTADLFDQAARANLSIVCPPPPGGRLDPSVVERLAQIAAWDLGGLSGPQDASAALREQQRLRGLDPDRDRPSLLRPGAYVREASRVADCLLIEPAVTRPGQTPGHVARELGEVVQAARPGSAFWVTLATQLDASQAAQLAMLRGGAPSREPLSYRALLRSSAVAGSCRPRGLAFRSAERLDQRDAATRQRALTLQLLNRRLGLLEPWLASGRMAAAARSSRPEVAGLVLQAERAYLIVPIAWDQPLLGGAFETGQPTALVLPGAAESAEAYLLTDVGTERLRTQRVTGGLRITLDALPENAFVLVTEDGQAFAQVRRYLQRGAAETAAAWCELTELRLADAQRSWALLPSSVAQDPLAMEPLARAEALLREAQNARNLGQFERACAAIAEADARLERHCVALSQRVAGASRPGEFPAVADWTTLGDLALTAAASQRDDGAWLPLGAGEFESLEQVLAAGWRRRQQDIPGCVTGVRLASAGAAAGQYCLELSARGEGEGPPPHWHGASVWVASPVIPAPAGYLIEIRGLARNAAPELGGVPPLWIFDSLGGEALGVAAGESAAWEPFHLRRVGAGGLPTDHRVAAVGRRPSRSGGISGGAAGSAAGAVGRSHGSPRGGHDARRSRAAFGRPSGGRSVTFRARGAVLVPLVGATYTRQFMRRFHRRSGRACMATGAPYATGGP
jgi:hypothetical protein